MKGILRSGALKVTVRLFAIYKEKAGAAEVELELPEVATVGFLAEEVVQRYPAITRDAATLVAAVNDEYREHHHVLTAGDEVAFIPPVSGGTI